MKTNNSACAPEAQQYKREGKEVRKSMRKIMALLCIVAICLSLVCIDRTYAVDQYDVLILVDYDIKDDIQAKLNQYMTDLNNEGWSYIQRNATASEMSKNETYFREILQNYYQDYSIKGAVLIGDFPNATWGRDPLELWFSTDYYYRDLDGNWTNTDEDKHFEMHTNETGDLAPEIWVGRIQSSNVDGDEAELINDYFQKNHNYRTNASSPTWPRRALAYLDTAICGVADLLDPDSKLKEKHFEVAADMSACLEGVYAEVETINGTYPDDTYTSAQDWEFRLNSTLGYEWAWLGSHGSEQPCSHSFDHYYWKDDDPPPPPHTWDTCSEEGNTYADFYLNHAPKVFFYIWLVCHAAQFELQNCLANSAIFGNGWGLVSIGGTWLVERESDFFEFFDKLNQGSCIGKAFNTFWNRTIDLVESKKWTILGDPTLCVSSAQETGTRYLQNAKWDSTYWKMLLYNTTTYTSKSKTMFGEISRAYLGIKVYNGTTWISGASVIQV